MHTDMNSGTSEISETYFKTYFNTEYLNTYKKYFKTLLSVIYVDITLIYCSCFQ